MKRIARSGSLSCVQLRPHVWTCRHPRVHIVEAAERIGDVLAQAVEQDRIDGFAIAILQAFGDSLRRGSMAAARVGVIEENA
jgi:hypothetical protein